MTDKDDWPVLGTTMVAILAVALIVAAGFVYVDYRDSSDLVIIDGNHHCSVGKVVSALMRPDVFMDRRTQRRIVVQGAIIVRDAAECEL